MSENIKFKANRQGIRLAVRAAIVRDNAILLVAFDDENGFHYNLPGGGVRPSETLYDAARREVREETAAEVEMKELLFVYECFPPDYGFSLDEKRHCVDFLFRCALCKGSEPRLPTTRTKTKSPFTGFRWMNFLTSHLYHKFRGK